MARAIARALEQTVVLLKDIAEGEGDLTKRLDGRGRDEIGQLSVWFNRFVDRLQDVMLQVARSAQDVTMASRMSSATAHLSNGAQEQASALEETAASMEELTSTVKQNADNARQANQLAAGSRTVAVQGGEVVAQVVRTMRASTSRRRRSPTSSASSTASPSRPTSWP